MFYLFIYGWEGFNLEEMLRYAAELENTYLHIVSWWLRCFEEFQEKEGVSSRRRAGWFWSQLTTAAHQTAGEIEHGSRVAVHESVCACVIQPARIPKLSPVLHKQPLNFLPNHTTVPPCTENSVCFWLPFDTSALLQFGKRGWTDLLSRAAFLSVFHLRDQQTSDEVFFFLSKMRNPPVETHATRY